MIYTVTFNPALDYVISVDHFTPGKINRTVSENMICGGKGINVSALLANLGYESTALGFVAGFTGAEMEKEERKSRYIDPFSPPQIHIFRYSTVDPTWSKMIPQEIHIVPCRIETSHRVNHTSLAPYF